MRARRSEAVPDAIQMPDDGKPQSLPSIHDLPPIETGGVEARQGFSFQDHVAAGFCLDMLQDESLTQVWCESQDDITLIWNGESVVDVEFVQVKKSEPNQLWSVALLCERTSKGDERIGSSILEKSLAYDRPFAESRRFRIVTARPLSLELKCLAQPTASNDRDPDTEPMQGLLVKLGTKVGDYRSPRGNTCRYWALNTVLDVRHSEDSVRNSNLLKLRRLVEKADEFLAQDQEEALYTRLLSKVGEAGAADPKRDPDRKKLRRPETKAWFDKVLCEAAHPAEGRTGTALERKMIQASIASDAVATANEERRRYRADLLRPKYLDRSDRQRMDGEVLATLQHLRARLDSGQIEDDGTAFHRLCLDNLAALRTDLQMEPPPPLFMLQGCMYAMTDRCIHRFRRVSA